MGTPTYMSPEQCRGVGQSITRSDSEQIRALGGGDDLAEVVGARRLEDVHVDAGGPDSYALVGGG